MNAPSPRPPRRVLRPRGLAVLVLLVAAAVFAAYRQTGKPLHPESAGASPGAAGEAAGSAGVVSRVDDGDSITLEDGRRVRYLGIDTPERGEPFHDEARAENLRLVSGKRVLVRRAGQDATDRFGRLLGIVSVDGASDVARANVNAALVRAGLAGVYVTGPRSVAKEDLEVLIEAQRAALAERKGVWRERLAQSLVLKEPLVATRFRIHRQSCQEVRSRNLPPIRSLEDELRQGKSLCRGCKPLGPTQ